MNEQVIDDLYNRAKSKGFAYSRDEFVAILHSNKDVFNDNYSYVKSKGYPSDENEFSTLIGKGAAQPEEVKKKGIQPPKPIQNATELPLAGTSSESQKPAQEPENEQGWLLNTVSALDKGFTKNLIGSPVKGLGTLLEGATGKGFVSDALINFGDYFNKAIDEITPQDESYKNSLSDQFAQAFGQVASQVATGAIGMVGKAGALASAERAIASQATKAAPTVGTFVKGAIGELKNPTVVSSGLSMGQAEFDRAKEAGATDEQAFEAFYKNAAVGSVLEKIPVMQFLKRFNKGTANGLTDYLKKRAMQGFTGGVEEMTTEVLQQLYANQTAADIYNINQKLFEDVGTSGGVGFGVGFLLNAMGANVKLLKKQGKNEEAAAIEGQMSQFENDMKNGGPSTYKFNGIPIKSREDMINLINKMDAAGLAKANIQVTNDPELAKLMQDRIVVTSTKEQVRQGNPNLNEPSLDAITELELELKKMEGNTTQTGKEKVAFIKQQIKNIQENPLADKPKQGLPQEIASLQDDEVVTTTVKTIDEVPEQFRDRAEFVEGMQGYTRKLILGLPIGKKEAIDGSGYRYSMSGKEVKTLASQRLGIEESQTKTQQNAVQEQGANESVLRTEQPQVGLQEVGEGNAQPTTTTEEEAITNEGPKEEVVRVQDALNGNNIFVRDGQKGTVRLDGQTVVFETDDKIVELGNVDELQNSTLDNFGISKEQELDLTLNDDNSITYNGKNYFNNYSNPELAFSKDKDGNYSVSLETANGQKRTFRGQQADQIVYQSRLKNFEQNATREQINEANRLADESIGIEEEVRQTSPQREGKAVGQVTETKTVTAPTIDLAQQLAERITVTPTTQDSDIESTAKALEESNKGTDVQKDETLTEWNGHKVGKTFTITNPDTQLPDSQVPLSKGKYTLMAIPISSTELAFQSNRNGISALEEGYFDESSLPFFEEGDEQESLNTIEKGFNTEERTPIIVERNSDGLYEVMDGHHRLIVANKLGKKTILALVKTNVTAKQSQKLSSFKKIAEDYHKALKTNESERTPEQVQLIKTVDERLGNKAKTVSSKTQVEPAKPVAPVVEAPKIEANTQEQPVVEEEVQPTVEEEDEVFEPLTIKGTTHETFTRGNASDFEEEEKEGDNGRTYTYLSRVTVPLVDEFTGDPIGYLVKIVDEDKNTSWQAEDIDNQELREDEFDTKKEAQQAIIDAHNKEKLKEFNKEKKAKEKAREKKAQADAKKKAKAEQKKNESSKTQVEPPKVDDLLNLDTKDKTNLKKVYDFLDNLGKGLEQFEINTNKKPENGKPKIVSNGITDNDVKKIGLTVAKAIVGTLKSLVNAGITLQEAINKAAIKHKVTKNNIIEALQKVAAAMKNVSEGISEFELPGYNQLSSIIDGRIAAKEDLKTVMEAVKQSDTYKGATDVQKDQLVREVRKRFGKSQKSSPSAVKNDIVFGIGRIFSTPKDITNITMSEKEALVKQIKDLGRGAKNAKQAVQIASEELSKQVKELVRKGKLTTTQASNVLRRFSKVNLLSQISIDKFVNHMAKVFANADYAAKLSESNKLRKELKSLSKDPDRNADLRKLAEKFVNIEPSMVENIDEYLSTAKSISDSVKGPKIIGEKLSFSPIVNIEETTNYINKQIDQQNETLQKQIADEIEGIEGVDLSEFSYEELLGLLEKNTKATKDDDKIVRSIATKAFDIFKSLINSMVENKVDPFTGEAVTYRPSQVEVINKFMNMDLNLLKTKDLAKAVHALMNFVQNKSTAGMEAVVSKYNGEKNSRIAVQEKIKSNPIKMFFNERFGKLMAENFMTLPALFERLFMTKSKSNRIQNLMGVADLVQKRAEAMTKANAFVSKYVNNFYKSKPNNEEFNTRNNMTERGMVAFMIRTVIGTKAQMKAEFNRRKGLIEQSIKALSQGNEQEQEKSKVYQEVYDKIVKDSENIEDVKSKSDAKNLEAVEYWTKEWDNLFEQFSDVASNVYNKVLEKELNYNPDNHKKLAREKEIVNFDDDESAFLSNDGMIYTKESNGLISVKRPKTLSVNEDTDRTERYIDLDFDYNNSKSLYDGLTDVYTAAPIRQVQAFLNSDSYSKIIPNTDDADLLKRRMRLYIQNIRGKNIYVNEDELSKTIKTLNQLASVGVGQALGGVSQIVKQSVPVLVNTLFNAGGLDISSAFNADKNNFMNNSGYGIANRGSASQADVDSLNKLIKKASESNLEKVGEFIKQANELWLKIFLEKPDAFVARMSWMTYYEKSLKQQGIDSKGIDYKTHKVNEKAAQYAQQMVDRQQNISDVDMSGKAFSEKEPTKNAILKMIAPFASFRLNQFVRVSNDVNVLKNWNSSTVEDRKDAVSSLAGFSAELATFKIISIGFTLLYGALALKFRDKEESEEEYQKRLKNTIKSQATSTVTDLISPLPMLDKYVQGGMSNTISTIQDIMKIDEKERFNIYGSNKSDDIRDLGTFGIPLERAGQTFDLIWLSNGGSFKNQFNQKRWLNQKDQDVLKKTAIPVSLMTTFGLLPNDFNTIVRNELNGAKKDATGTEGGKSDVQVMEDIEAKQATERNKIEKQQKEDLLGDFKNESDMKKYDRKAWEKNFGEKSEWYKDHKEEMDAERKARAEERKALDEENDYVPKTKSSRSKGGLFDNSSKGSRGLFDESKKSGGLFGKKKKW